MNTNSFTNSNTIVATPSQTKISSNQAAVSKKRFGRFQTTLNEISSYQLKSSGEYQQEPISGINSSLDANEDYWRKGSKAKLPSLPRNINVQSAEFVPIVSLKKVKKIVKANVKAKQTARVKEDSSLSSGKSLSFNYAEGTMLNQSGFTMEKLVQSKKRKTTLFNHHSQGRQSEILIDEASYDSKSNNQRLLTIRSGQNTVLSWNSGSKLGLFRAGKGSLQTYSQTSSQHHFLNQTTESDMRSQSVTDKSALIAKKLPKRKPIESLRVQRKSFVEQEKFVSRALNHRSPPLNKNETQAIRDRLTEEVTFKLEEEKAKIAFSNLVASSSVGPRPTKVSWKGKLGVGDIQYEFDRNQPFLWHTAVASKVLSMGQIKELDSQLDLIKYVIRTESEFKYLQVYILSDFLEKLIAQNKDDVYSLNPRQKSQMTIKEFAALKVYRKSLEMEKPVTSETVPFNHPSQMLNYSWRLFRDKMNSNTILLQDKENPRVKFNISKYFEFMHQSELHYTRDLSESEMQEIIDQLDFKAMMAIGNREHIRRSPLLGVIDLITSELNDRQNQGIMRRDYCSAQKNTIAMKFVDLYDRVKGNQRMAMVDTKIASLPRREREKAINDRQALEQAGYHQDTLSVLVQKRDEERAVKDAKHQRLLNFAIRKNLTSTLSMTPQAQNSPTTFSGRQRYAQTVDRQKENFGVKRSLPNHPHNQLSEMRVDDVDSTEENRKRKNHMMTQSVSLASIEEASRNPKLPQLMQNPRTCSVTELHNPLLSLGLKQKNNLQSTATLNQLNYANRFTTTSETSSLEQLYFTGPQQQKSIPTLDNSSKTGASSKKIRVKRSVKPAVDLDSVMRVKESELASEETENIFNVAKIMPKLDKN